MRLPNSVNKIFHSQRNKKRKVFQDDFSHGNIPTPGDHKSQIPRVKALKYRVVEMEFSSNR